MSAMRLRTVCVDPPSSWANGLVREPTGQERQDRVFVHAAAGRLKAVAFEVHSRATSPLQAEEFEQRI